MEIGFIFRLKSFKDVDMGDFDCVKVWVFYVDSWNLVNFVGCGRLVIKI